ncbi:MAG TPA: TIGR00341 family protein [Candidatus Obscuribacterales bacterium]
MKSKLKLKQVSGDALIQMRQDLVAESTLCFNYIILVITACLIATFGLLSNSTAVIIGAMLVAPIMLPLRGLAFGILKSDQELSRRGIISIVVGTLVALILSMTLGKITGIEDFGSEVLARTQPNLIDLGIAVVAGGLSGFTKVEKGISDAVAGTAIAVALMPPLCVVGLTLSQGYFDLSYGATLLYLTNLIGIALACMIVFIVAGYSRLRKQFALTLIIAAALAIPLGISFLQFVTQLRLQTDLRKIFEQQTLTGQRVDLQETNINWKQDPPKAYLKVRATEPVTPRQVRLVEDFINKKMRHNFALVFLVEEVQRVEAEKE